MTEQCYNANKTAHPFNNIQPRGQTLTVTRPRNVTAISQIYNIFFAVCCRVPTPLCRHVLL